jgi:hypothetical protein
VAAKPIEEDEIEEGEILDAAAAMDADADSQASLAPVSLSLSPPSFPNLAPCQFRTKNILPFCILVFPM